MNVKTADLKNNLSKYLRQVRAGRTVTVLDRDKPIATLSPIATGADEVWLRERNELIARHAKRGLTVTPPLKRPPAAPLADLKPALAPDGRRDIRTVDLARGDRNW